MGLGLLAILFTMAPACSSQARILRADGSQATGTLLHADDDIVVLRNARLIAPRNGPAPFTDRRGRASYVQREPEIAIPRADIVRLQAFNHSARKAGIAGTIVFGVGLIVLIPSAIGIQSCSRNFFGCVAESVGVTLGTAAVGVGLVTGIAGWIIYANSKVDEAGEIVPLAPSVSGLGFKF